MCLLRISRALLNPARLWSNNSVTALKIFCKHCREREITPVAKAVRHIRLRHANGRAVCTLTAEKSSLAAA
jgi:hypothetical protein